MRLNFNEQQYKNPKVHSDFKRFPIIPKSLTFLVFSESSISVLSTSFWKEGLFRGSSFQQDSIMSYLQRVPWGHGLTLNSHEG